MYVGLAWAGLESSERWKAFGIEEQTNIRIERQNLTMYTIIDCEN
jgi:predicted small integral membrane protein